jgi:hypothetical protein
MTEAEWLACDDPKPMLEFLRGKASDRRLLLFLCACGRRLDDLLTDRRSRQCTEVVERFVDANATKEELRAALMASEAVLDGFSGAVDMDPLPIAATVAHDTAYFADGGEIEIGVVAGLCRSASEAAATVFTNASPDATQSDWIEARRAEEAEQARLLRDIFGDPFRPVTFDPTWLSPDVLGLARTIYDERAFDRMLLLAVALEESGCHEPNLLNHCRQPGEHVRGCWVVDALLGKDERPGTRTDPLPERPAV